MDIGRAEDHLQLAWIELEYAGADVAELSASANELSEVADLDLKRVLVKLAVANLALQIAISALADRPRIAELKIVN